MTQCRRCQVPGGSRRPRSAARLVAGLCLAVCLGASAAAQPPPAVSWADGAVDGRLAAPEGHAWIRWEVEDERVEAFLLERSSPGRRTATRRITDTGTFITGLPEGTTELRIRSLRDGGEGPWSDTLSIDVSYPPMSQVHFLVGLGLALLMATIVLILAGHRSFGRRAAAGGRRD